jgi:prephenate dehydrogenase
MSRVKRLAIIGVGLIGGSLALALRRGGYVAEVVGCGRRIEALRGAQQLGIIDRWETEPALAAEGADMVVVAVPVGAMEAVFRSLAGCLSAQSVLTDVGSTKGQVVEAARAAFGIPAANFVPGHPIAGTERSGYQAAFPELFEGRRVILTPLAETDAAAVHKVRGMWQHTGAEVVEMAVRHHDEILAATSHLPHVLAYSLVHTLAGMDESWEIFRYAAGGFRDFTRIAASDPGMWRDICLGNKAAILECLRRFTDDLDRLRLAIEASDGEHLIAAFSRAKQARDHFAASL